MKVFKIVGLFVLIVILLIISYVAYWTFKPIKQSVGLTNGEGGECLYKITSDGRLIISKGLWKDNAELLFADKLKHPEFFTATIGEEVVKLSLFERFKINLLIYKILKKGEYNTDADISDVTRLYFKVSESENIYSEYIMGNYISVLKLNIRNSDFMESYYSQGREINLPLSSMGVFLMEKQREVFSRLVGR